MNTDSKKTTIRDIAEQANVSTTTVYKALHNMKGVSDRKRQEILELAQNMKYTCNTAAQSLARKEIHIGIITEVYNKEFSQYVIDGINHALESLEDFKLIGHFGKFENSMNRPRVLQEFSEMVNGGMNALILIPTGPYKEYASYNDVIRANNLPIITINNLVPGLDTFCSILQDSTMLGRVAGDLMNLCNPSSNNVVFIGSKDVYAHYNSAQEFERRIAETGSVVSTIYENRVDNDIGYILTDNMVQNYPDVTGIFVGVSQSMGTIRKLQELGITDKYKIITVGTYPQLLDLLSKKVITATIDRHPFDMGQLAIKLLYDYLTKDITPPKKLYIPTTVLTRGALEDNKNLVRSVELL